jgi:hypothetical protein
MHTEIAQAGVMAKIAPDGFGVDLISGFSSVIDKRTVGFV